MSYGPDSLDIVDGYCNPIMRGIANVFDPSNTTFMDSPTGTLQFLMSEQNRELAQINEVQTTMGGVRQVRVTRIQRGTTSDAITGTTCEVTSDSGFIEQIIDVNQEPCTVSFNVSIDVLERYCDELLMYERGDDMSTLSSFRAINQQIMSKMNALRLCINNRVTASILASAGINVATGVNTPTTITLLDSTTGAKIELGLQEFIEDMELNELPGRPGVVGSGVLSRFNTSLMYGCCNSGGLDWNAMAESAPWYFYFDKQVGVLSGNLNEFLVLAPGAVQFLFVNRSAIPARQQNGVHGTTQYGMIMDPYVPGLIYDLAIKQNDCATGEYDPSWTIFLSSKFDLAFIPDNAFSTDDDLFGWNGVFRYIGATN